MGSIAAERRVAEIACTQCGTFSVRQADEAGVSERQRRHLLDTGRWDRLAHGVLGLPGHRNTWVRQLWVAHLHARTSGVIARRSAALRHGLQTIDVADGRPVELITPRRAGRALGGTTRLRTDTLTPEEIVVIGGLPTTDPTRTIVDLSEVLRIGRLEDSAETFLLTGRTTPEALAETHTRLRSPARPGVMMRRLLDILGKDGAVLDRSELERLLVAVVEQSDLPPPRWEYPLPTTTAMRGFVDCCWPEVRFIVEADGRRWHDRRQQAELDLARDHEAAELGFFTLRLRHSHLAYERNRSVQKLQRIFEQRRTRRAHRALSADS